MELLIFARKCYENAEFMRDLLFVNREIYGAITAKYAELAQVNVNGHESTLYMRYMLEKQKRAENGDETDAFDYTRYLRPLRCYFCASNVCVIELADYDIISRCYYGCDIKCECGIINKNIFMKRLGNYKDGVHWNYSCECECKKYIPYSYCVLCCKRHKEEDLCINCCKKMLFKVIIAIKKEYRILNCVNILQLKYVDGVEKALVYILKEPKNEVIILPDGYTEAVKYIVKNNIIWVWRGSLNSGWMWNNITRNIAEIGSLCAKIAIIREVCAEWLIADIRAIIEAFICDNV
jgi:hypothetical protein